MSKLENSKPIRVLHILQRMEAAGIQTFLMNIYRNIDRERVQFDFLVQYKADEFYDEEIKKLGGNIYKFSVREDYNVLKYKMEIRAFFEKHKEYKIIHGHMETLSDIWEYEAKRANIPVIIVHSHIAGFNEKNIIKLLIKEYYRKNYGRYSTKRFACSKAAANFMFSDKTYEVIPNAIMIEKYRFSNEKRNIRKEFGIDKEYLIGHVGRFHPQKNHQFILKIAEEIKRRNINAKIIMVGDGELRSTIENQIDSRNIKDIVLLTGNRKDVDALYSAMDMFIMPSLFEGLPLAGVEAQAAGLPCLFANSITEELAITDLAEFMPINDGVAQWVNKIEEYISKPIDRIKYAEIVAYRGYDTGLLASRMEKIYIQAFEEAGKSNL